MHAAILVPDANDVEQGPRRGRGLGGLLSPSESSLVNDGVNFRSDGSDSGWDNLKALSRVNRYKK